MYNFISSICYLFQFIFMYIFSKIFSIDSYNHIIKYGIENYYLGDMQSTKNLLKNENINLKLVINCTYDLDFYNKNNNNIYYYRIPLSDMNIKKSSEYLELNKTKICSDIFNLLNLIKKKERNEEFSVLFHCRNGTQRSATCLLLFLRRLPRPP